MFFKYAPYALICDYVTDHEKKLKAGLRFSKCIYVLKYFRKFVMITISPAIQIRCDRHFEWKNSWRPNMYELTARTGTLFLWLLFFTMEKFLGLECGQINRKDYIFLSCVYHNTFRTQFDTVGNMIIFLSGKFFWLLNVAEWTEKNRYFWAAIMKTISRELHKKCIFNSGS